MTVNMSKLAITMLQWEEKRLELDKIEADIIVTVLEIGKTQVVGNVRATYSGGRKKYDYEAAGQSASKTIVQRNSTVKVDWRSVCKDLGLATRDLPYTMGSPYVSVKLVD
jgi:hypothetical protein